MKTIIINGKEKQFQTLPANIAELLESLKVDAATVVAELDGRIIERANFASEPLTEESKIELIRFVPGG